MTPEELIKEALEADTCGWSEEGRIMVDCGIRLALALQAALGVQPEARVWGDADAKLRALGAIEAIGKVHTAAQAAINKAEETKDV